MRWLAMMLVWIVSFGVQAEAEARRPLRELSGEASVASAATLDIRYDDGEADDGARASFPSKFEFAMRFDAGAAGDLEQVQVCLQRLSAGDSGSGTVGVAVHAAGASGPGALLGAYAANVSGFPVTGIPGAFRTFGLPEPLPVPASFYLVVELDSLTSDFYMCQDHDGIAGARPVYLSLDDGIWVDHRLIAPSLKALMVRARVETEDAPPPGDCVPDSDTLCLIDGRYRIEVDYSTSLGGGAAGKAGVVGGIDYVDSGLFYFFEPSNWELLIKVLDACPVNGHVWVFYAATTNVGFTLRVTDTETGATWARTNPDRTVAMPVQDTTAFVCP